MKGTCVRPSKPEPCSARNQIEFECDTPADWWNGIQCKFSLFVMIPSCTLTHKKHNAMAVNTAGI